MTIDGPETAGTPEDQIADNGRYHIGLARLEHLNRSAVDLIAGRLTAACPSYGQPPSELDPLALIGEIQKFHADTEGFIRFDMPIQEIVFRTLLARGNDPIDLSDLHRDLTVRWSNALRPIAVDEDQLRRVLDSDAYYGFEQA